MAVFYEFFKHDIYVHWQSRKRFSTNFGIVWPLVYSIAYGYIQPRALFGPNASHLSTVSFIGNIILILMILAWALLNPLLHDLNNNRFINYQITILRPELILIQRILSASLVSFICVLPFFPVTKLLLGHHFVTTHSSWPAVILILFFSCLFACSYSLFALSLISKPVKAPNFWLRINTPLIMLGGFWVPWYITQEFLPSLSRILLLNPMLYLSEGLRSAFMGSDQFISYWICIPMLIVYSCLFTLLACKLFKRRIDHI